MLSSSTTSDHDTMSLMLSSDTDSSTKIDADAKIDADKDSICNNYPH